MEVDLFLVGARHRVDFTHEKRESQPEASAPPTPRGHVPSEWTKLPEAQDQVLSITKRLRLFREASNLEIAIFASPESLPRMGY